jgi:hypothetical protein
MKLIWIDTRRHSAVVKAFVLKHPAAKAELDGIVQVDPLAGWCTKKRLRNAINFFLKTEQEEIIGFHDGPWNIWANESELPLIEELKTQKPLRYSIAETQPRQSIIKQVLKWIMSK